MLNSLFWLFWAGWAKRVDVISFHSFCFPSAFHLHYFLLHFLTVHYYFLSIPTPFLPYSLYIASPFLLLTLYIFSPFSHRSFVPYIIPSESKLNGQISRGKLNLVDLAGSERINKSGEKNEIIRNPKKSKEVKRNQEIIEYSKIHKIITKSRNIRCSARPARY